VSSLVPSDENTLLPQFFGSPSSRLLLPVPSIGPHVIHSSKEAFFPPPISYTTTPSFPSTTRYGIDHPSACLSAPNSPHWSHRLAYHIAHTLQIILMAGYMILRTFTLLSPITTFPGRPYPQPFPVSTAFIIHLTSLDACEPTKCRRLRRAISFVLPVPLSMGESPIDSFPPDTTPRTLCATPPSLVLRMESLAPFVFLSHCLLPRNAASDDLSAFQH
jgi:hypothetical protein